MPLCVAAMAWPGTPGEVCTAFVDLAVAAAVAFGILRAQGDVSIAVAADAVVSAGVAADAAVAVAAVAAADVVVSAGVAAAAAAVGAVVSAGVAELLIWEVGS